MAAPVTRQQLKDYCLRRLGAPVISINVEDSQVDDRVDEALALYYERHYDGSSKSFYKHQITDQNKIDQFVQLPTNVTGVVNVFPLWQSGAGRVGDMFDIQYQIALNDMYSLTTVSLVPYVMTMTHLNMLNDLFTGQQPFRFNKKDDILHIDTNWKKFNTGDWMLFEVYIFTDPETYPKVWADRWLLAYATALIKRQWGENLSKFSAIVMTGGVQLNGVAILQTAHEEIAKLEDDLMTKYTMPAMDLFG